MFHLYSPQPRKVQPALTFKWLVNCPRCDGWGWYSRDGYDEVWCEDETCEARKWRRIYDGCRDDVDAGTSTSTDG